MKIVFTSVVCVDYCTLMVVHTYLFGNDPYWRDAQG